MVGFLLSDVVRSWDMAYISDVENDRQWDREVCSRIFRAV